MKPTNRLSVSAAGASRVEAMSSFLRQFHVALKVLILLPLHVPADCRGRLSCLVYAALGMEPELCACQAALC